MDYCNLDYDEVSCDSWLIMWWNTWLSVCLCMSACLCDMLRVLSSENDRMSHRKCREDNACFTSVYKYLPPPDEQSNSHGEQHDEGGHGHDDDDHHWTLFAGRQRHWKWQHTLITLNWTGCATISLVGNHMLVITPLKTQLNTPACSAHTFNYCVLSANKNKRWEQIIRRWPSGPN